MYTDAVDEALAAVGLVRKVVIWKPSFLAVLAVVARTELIATAPVRVATLMVPSLPVTIHPLPLELPPSKVALYRHPRCKDDPGHGWFRQLIGQVLREESVG